MSRRDGQFMASIKTVEMNNCISGKCRHCLEARCYATDKLRENKFNKY